MPGRFVVVEGLDGSGLHQVASLVFDLFYERYGLKDRWLTREPSEGPVGGLLRLAIDGRLNLAPEALPLFFAADRADHLFRSDGILYRLNKGESVICDRYYLSSYAYQTADLRPETEEFNQRLSWLRAINERICRAPDLTLFIDQPVESCARRLLDEQRELGHSQITKVDLEEPATWGDALSRLTRIRSNYLAVIQAIANDSTREEAIEIIGSGDMELAPNDVNKEVRKRLEKVGMKVR